MEKLVEFDTTSYRSNLALIDFVEDWLVQHNVTATRVFDDSGKKANLYATIGPPDTAGIMLSGHTDVVPVENQSWSSDPFTLTQRDKTLVGRGTADMKGFIASVLASVPKMTSEPLQTPLHLAFSYDEEVGCLGVRRLIDMMKDLDTVPGMAIIGEPTSMAPVIGHKGKVGFMVNVTGVTGHSAYTTEAINAVEYASRLICYINDLHRVKMTSGPFDNAYRVPHTTLHVGTINGGTALNVVPSECAFKFEIRNLPNDDSSKLTSQIKHYAAELEIEMRKTFGDSTISFTEIINYPGLNTDPESSAVSVIKQLLDLDTPVDKVSFGTEGGLFTSGLGIPSVVCGPGNILQAHKPDEFISLEQLDYCDRVMDRLINRCRSAELL